MDSTQNLVLDASLSYDPDYDGTADPDLKFDWTCLQVGYEHKHSQYRIQINSKTRNEMNKRNIHSIKYNNTE